MKAKKTRGIEVPLATHKQRIANELTDLADNFDRMANCQKVAGDSAAVEYEQAAAGVRELIAKRTDR